MRNFPLNMVYWLRLAAAMDKVRMESGENMKHFLLGAIFGILTFYFLLQWLARIPLSH